MCTFLKKKKKMPLFYVVYRSVFAFVICVFIMVFNDPLARGYPVALFLLTTCCPVSVSVKEVEVTFHQSSLSLDNHMCMCCRVSLRREGERVRMQKDEKEVGT